MNTPELPEYTALMQYFAVCVDAKGFEEYEHHVLAFQTAIRAYGEACRAATPQGEPKQFKPYMGPLTNEGAQSLWETLNDTERHDQTPVHIHFAYALLRRYGPPKEPPAPATGSVLTDEQIDKFAVQFLSASAPTRNAYDVRRFARAILAAKGETS